MFLFKKKKDKSDIPKTEPIQGSKLAVEVEFADGSTAMLGGFGDITIGSGETCDCTLQGEDIFESHCRIFTVSDRYYIENVDAFAITRIGGMRIFQSNPIREGDVITLGRSVEFVIKQL